ncbi:MAG: topoisomerase DNA-binding C4 zinc finger domain-containing protein [Crocinitomicaceae bacterium]|nr:topoisomerase DNA-binding C4 zinc finger domain-containing protein [Crocinitomicaceae bacterium]
MIIKLGRSGKFLSCGRYPDCDGALTMDGQEVGKEKPFGVHPTTGEHVYVMTGRFGAYVQQGEMPEKPKLTKFPKRSQENSRRQRISKA